MFKKNDIILFTGRGKRHGHLGRVTYVNKTPYQSDVRYAVEWCNPVRREYEAAEYRTDWLLGQCSVAHSAAAQAVPAAGAAPNSHRNGLYFCAVDGREAPRKAHASIAVARAEAVRLANSTGQHVSVYQQVGRIELEEVRVVKTETKAVWK